MCLDRRKRPYTRSFYFFNFAKNLLRKKKILIYNETFLDSRGYTPKSSHILTMILFRYGDAANQCSNTIVVSKYFHDSQITSFNKIAYIFSSGAFPLGAFITYFLSRRVYAGELDFYYYIGVVIGATSVFGKINTKYVSAF
jgi:hypothetical protein